MNFYLKLLIATLNSSNYSNLNVQRFFVNCEFNSWIVATN
jgi:hypothetical protein